MSGLCDQVEPLLEFPYQDNSQRAPILFDLLDGEKRVREYALTVGGPLGANREGSICAWPKAPAHELVQIEAELRCRCLHHLSADSRLTHFPSANY